MENHYSLISKRKKFGTFYEDDCKVKQIISYGDRAHVIKPIKRQKKNKK